MALDNVMYNPILFSPETFLTSDIGAADTRIYVDDVSCFPDAPTLATIGRDSDGEVVKVLSIGLDFVDVVRGFGGDAKPWSMNTNIARYFSAFDQDAIQKNIKQLDDEKLNSEELQQHVNNHSNPHSVTASQVGAYTKAEVNTKMGNLSFSIDPEDNGLNIIY